MSGVRRRPAAALLLAVLLVAIRLIALQSSPPGLHQDEAAIGYNAWAIAHHGVDEHGASFPLFFESFGDYKSPLYFYLLVPFTWVLPLTPFAIRLPAAICGLAVCVVAVLTLRRLGAPRGALVLQMLTAALMPWLFLESRVGFEVVTLTLALAMSLWCLAHALGGDGDRWFTGAGLALAAALFAYPTGRLLVALLLACLCAVRLSVATPRRWWLALIPPVAGYALLGSWALRHPGALTARFDALSILHDHPGPATAVTRFAANWIGYVDAPFLLLRGDSNPRHATGAGGMLMLATLPALAAGVSACWRRRGDPFPRLVLLGVLAAPIPAALTAEGSPHALRSAAMIAFLLVLMGYGWRELLPWLGRRMRWRTALVALAILQAAVYLTDLYVSYPDRAAGSFDVGIGEAVLAAHQLAGGHTVFLSENLGQPYAHALFELRPAPGATLAATMASIHMRQRPAARLGAEARPGDVAVLSPRDHAPDGARVIEPVRIPAAWWRSQIAAVIYRL